MWQLTKTYKIRDTNLTKLEQIPIDGIESLRDYVYAVHYKELYKQTHVYAYSLWKKNKKSTVDFKLDGPISSAWQNTWTDLVLVIVPLLAALVCYTQLLFAKLTARYKVNNMKQRMYIIAKPWAIMLSW